MAPQRLCCIPDCDKPHIARGWCKAHYERWKRNGSPLLGNVGPSSPDGPVAFLLNVALKEESEECLTWPFAKGSKNYAVVVYQGRLQRVSRLTCEAQNGPAPSPTHQAAHLCGKGHLACVRKNHLVWKTPLENAADRIVHGTNLRGTQIYGNKLSPEDVRRIRGLKGTQTMEATGVQFGVTAALVSLIQNRKAWVWLE